MLRLSRPSKVTHRHQPPCVFPAKLIFLLSGCFLSGLAGSRSCCCFSHRKAKETDPISNIPCSSKTGTGPPSANRMLASRTFHPERGRDGWREHFRGHRHNLCSHSGGVFSGTPTGRRLIPASCLQTAHGPLKPF